MYRGRPTPGPNGFEVFGPSRADYDYCLCLLESGHLEVIDAFGRFCGKSQRFLPSQSILEDLHDTLLFFGKIYQEVGYFGPVQLYYRLLGIRGSRLGVRYEPILLPEPVQEDEWERGISTDVWAMVQSPLEIVRHFMDLVWSAYGYRRCLLFNEQGGLRQK